MVMNQPLVPKGIVTAMNVGETIDAAVSSLEVVHVEVEETVVTGMTNISLIMHIIIVFRWNMRKLKLVSNCNSTKR